MACACPVVTSNVTAMPEIAGGAAVLTDPEDPQSIAQASSKHSEATACATRSCGVRPTSRGARPARRRSTSTARSPTGDDAAPDEGSRHRRRGLHRFAHVRPAAGPRSRRRGARRAAPDPCIRDAPATSRPTSTSTRATFATATCSRTSCAGSTCRLPLRRVPGLLARLLAVLRRERRVRPRCSTRSSLPSVSTSHGSSSRSSQAAMGEGLYRCPVDGEQVPGMRPEADLAAGRWDIACPVCRGRARAAGHAGAHLEPAERVRNVEARRGDGRRQPRPPVRHPYGRAALQHRAGTATVRVQRVLGRVSNLLPQLPAGHRADLVRGRPDDPRRRQHRRRRRRQRPRARRRSCRGPRVQRRRRPRRSPPASSPTSSCASTARRTPASSAASTASAIPGHIFSDVSALRRSVGTRAGCRPIRLPPTCLARRHAGPEGRARRREWRSMRAAGVVRRAAAR